MGERARSGQPALALKGDFQPDLHDPFPAVSFKSDLKLEPDLERVEFLQTTDTRRLCIAEIGGDPSVVTIQDIAERRVDASSIPAGQARIVKLLIADQRLNFTRTGFSREQIAGKDEIALPLRTITQRPGRSGRRDVAPQVIVIVGGFERRHAEIGEVTLDQKIGVPILDIGGPEGSGRPGFLIHASQSEGEDILTAKIGRTVVVPRLRIPEVQNEPPRVEQFVRGVRSACGVAFSLKDADLIFKLASADLAPESGSVVPADRRVWVFLYRGKVPRVQVIGAGEIGSVARREESTGPEIDVVIKLELDDGV